MTKPITPSQAKSPRLGSKEHKANLKKIVTRRLNSMLRKHQRLINVENHIDDDQAEEIANEFAASGWTVTRVDRRRDRSQWGWSFKFAVEFAVGEEVIIEMNDLIAWPEPLDGKIIAVEQASPTEKTYEVAYTDATGNAVSKWLSGRYLAKK